MSKKNYTVSELADMTLITEFKILGVNLNDSFQVEIFHDEDREDKTILLFIGGEFKKHYETVGKALKSLDKRLFDL